jgi:hypothetical protein
VPREDTAPPAPFHDHERALDEAVGEAKADNLKADNPKEPDSKTLVVSLRSSWPSPSVRWR